MNELGINLHGRSGTLDTRSGSRGAGSSLRRGGAGGSTERVEGYLNQFLILWRVYEQTYDEAEETPELAALGDTDIQMSVSS